MILAERTARAEAEAVAASAKAEAATAQADLSSHEALIAHLKLQIEKLRRELYGSRSERTARLLEQMELQLEDLEAAATEDELAAEKAAARTETVKSFERRRPSRKPFPEHLPRERVVIAAPENCPCCGSAKLSKLGEDVTPAPSGSPNLLAMILFEKFGQHQPKASPRCTPYIIEAVVSGHFRVNSVRSSPSMRFSASWARRAGGLRGAGEEHQGTRHRSETRRSYVERLSETRRSVCMSYPKRGLART